VADVVTGGERPLSGAGQDPDADRVVGLDVADRLVQLAVHRGRDRVDRAVADRDRRDLAGLLDLDAHG